ncbi:MAG: type II toxin-antitoxin system RelE/ParE family toxin [Novosphingobium sp.]
MAEIEFSKAAEADLDDIDDYSVTRFGAGIADRYMRGFDEAFARLGDFPKVGRPMPALGAGVRCLIHRRHRVFYRLSEERVLILRIVHHAQNVRRPSLR